RRERNSSFYAINKKIEELLEISTLHLNLNLDEVVYDQFKATDLKADISFQTQKIDINDVQLKHADGHLNLTGKVEHLIKNNPFKINTQIQHVNISKLFKAFNNFGQYTLQDQNIEGKASALVELKGGFN